MYNDKGESYRYEEPKNSWSEPAVFEIIPVNGNTSKIVRTVPYDKRNPRHRYARIYRKKDV